MIFDARSARGWIWSRPIDFRNYSEPVIMLSGWQLILCCQMVRSIDPRRVTLRQFRWPFKVVALLGTRVAETILASGRVRPHEKAAHMEASDPIEDICKKLLASGSRPHMELESMRATVAAAA